MKSLKVQNVLASDEKKLVLQGTYDCLYQKWRQYHDQIQEITKLNNYQSDEDV